MQRKTRREITEVRAMYLGDAHTEYSVMFRVWGTNGKDLGTWHYYTSAVDEAGAALNTLLHWRRLDARNEKRRANKVRKEQADATAQEG